MAPRMLRQVNDKHFPDILQHRNIRHREFVEMLSAMDEEDSMQTEPPDSPNDALSVRSLNLSEALLQLKMTCHSRSSVCPKQAKQGSRLRA